MGREKNVKKLAAAALVFTVLSGIGWIVFLGGFGYLTNHPNVRFSSITGPAWDPFWVISVLSPILFILLIVKAILMIINDELFRRFFVIHFLAVIACISTVILLCFSGSILVAMRGLIQSNNEYAQPTDAYVIALFAGPLLEVLFLGVAWICHILAYLSGRAKGEDNNSTTATKA